MSITRRDFLNGVAITIAAGLTPLELAKAAGKASAIIGEDYYPPQLTGMRGNHPGSFEMAHAIGRDHKKFSTDHLPIEEEYDLVIVGGGLSGLSAASFWHDLMGKESKVLVLDNHDDFGGHAKRNEFNAGGKKIIGYGGSEAFQSPTRNFSDEVNGLMTTVGVSVTRMKQSFDVNFYPNLNLSRGVFFDKKNFGETKIVGGDPGRAVADDIPPDRLNGRSLEAFINDFPLSESDRKAILDLYINPVDYLKGMTVDEKTEWMDTHSYRDFLAEKVGLSKMAIMYFQQRTNDFFAIGIEGVSCSDARTCALPGMVKGKGNAEKEVIGAFIKAVPDLTWKMISKPVYDHDTIAFRWEFSGKNSGEWAGSPATNNPIKFEGVSYITVNNGKITWQGDYYDSKKLDEELKPAQ